MKILVEVQENKASFLMELLRNLPFVKAKELHSEAGEGLKEALKEIKYYEEGKIMLPDAKEVFETLLKEK